MALSTYGELKTAVARWMVRSDLDAVIPDFIALAETKLNRVLRVSEMETAAVGTSTNGLLILPDDYAGWRSVEAYPYGALDFVEPNWAASEYPSAEGGVPRYFSIIGGNLATYPSFTGELTLGYYAKVPSLSEASPTNWLLASSPDIYLFMTLAEGFAYMADYAQAGTWTERAGAAIAELGSHDRAKRYARVVARVKGPTP